MHNYSRLLELPNRSFFLFGPRGTGKSSWLKEKLPNALIFDLLRSGTYLSLLQDPASLRNEIDATKPEWVIIDEIQKLPILLDEVHSIIADYQGKIKFALTGSSARKLKRTEVNLLAGRAITKNMYTLTLKEMNYTADLENLLQFGCLPEVQHYNAKIDKIEFLESYVQTYLKEEIQQETRIRDLLGFSRFLKVSAILNAQQLNLSNIARECGVSRTTVNGHFSILIDTLLGRLVEPYRPNAKVREVSSPKFYFFDPGVVCALKGSLRDKLESKERGLLLETLFLNELMAANSYYRYGGEIFYWRTSDGNEVDFILKRGKLTIGFEVKSSTQWKKDYNFGLTTLLKEKKIDQAYGIYLGKKELKSAEVHVYPLSEFPFKEILS